MIHLGRFSNLTIGRFVTGSYFYSQYRTSDREWDDKAIFAAQIAALIGVERALMSGVGAAVRTPHFWAAAIPVAVGAAISYAIDQEEGLSNYEDFIFNMDLHEKIEATVWAGDVLLKEGAKETTSAVKAVAPTLWNVALNRGVVEYMITKNAVALLR